MAWAALAALAGRSIHAVLVDAIADAVDDVVVHLVDMIDVDDLFKLT